MGRKGRRIELGKRFTLLACRVLLTEILDYFPAIGPSSYNAFYYYLWLHFLPEIYHRTVRVILSSATSITDCQTDIPRTLALFLNLYFQTCILFKLFMLT